MLACAEIGDEAENCSTRVKHNQNLCKASKMFL